MNLHIVIDSASNCRNLKDRKGISYSIVPLSICTNEREFVDDETLNIEEMVEYLESTKLPSHSACPGVVTWKKCFKGQSYVIALTLTGALSGCYNAGRIAGEEYMEENEKAGVFVFDTNMIGPVEKLCAEFIERKCEEISDDENGIALSKESFDDICNSLKEYCNKHLNIGFCLKSLNNLANNGRINRAVAKVAKTLKICVAGDFHEGELRPTDKVRGEKKGMEAVYRNMRESGYDGGRVIIDHCFASETAELLEGVIKRDYPSADVTVAPTTGLCSFYAERGGIVVGYER